jgi:hypothetical protein
MRITTLQNNKKSDFGKNLGLVEPGYLATSFYPRSQGETSPWDMKGSGGAHHCKQRRATQTYAGAGVPLGVLTSDLHRTQTKDCSCKYRLPLC